MSSDAPPFLQPALRSGVKVSLDESSVLLELGSKSCSFEFQTAEKRDISHLLRNLETGGFGLNDLARLSPTISDGIGELIRDLDRHRFLRESAPNQRAMTGQQLYRELQRISDRVVEKNAKSRFKNGLDDGTVGSQQIIGYALEYFWIVRSAPCIIGPSLASAHGRDERRILQQFLASELGHDTFLAGALSAIGFSRDNLEDHQPLPATFSVGASLGVYALQHPLSFKACLFLLERTQPEFVDSFEKRCIELGFPEAFYGPFRKHSEINDEYDHEDISGDLLRLESAIDLENASVVKRHVALMVETIIQQEDQILDYYGSSSAVLPRIFT